MAFEPVVIPEKIYFKIGEVCELLGVQAHVLRYWETEFPMLSPQKNKSGQRSYRRKDVEMALKIKQLLYQDMFTIAGARKKIQSDQRGGAKARPAAEPQGRPASTNKVASAPRMEAPMLFDTSPWAAAEHGREQDAEHVVLELDHPAGERPLPPTGGHEEILRNIASQLLELREMLRSGTN